MQLHIQVREQLMITVVASKKQWRLLVSVICAHLLQKLLAICQFAVGKHRFSLGDHWFNFILGWDFYEAILSTWFRQCRLSRLMGCTFMLTAKVVWLKLTECPGLLSVCGGDRGCPLTEWILLVCAEFYSVTLLRRQVRLRLNVFFTSQITMRGYIFLAIFIAC